MVFQAPLPAHPVMLSVYTREADGTSVARASLMADATQLGQLLSEDSNSVKDHTIRNLRLVLLLPDAPIELREAPDADPVIVAA